MYKPCRICRACGLDDLYPVFDLGVQPLANNFTALGGECAGYAPLQVLFCRDCTLAQLSVVVRPDILYANYPYVTSRSQTMQDHFGLLWESIKAECQPESVVEIGSNDGHFLKFCKQHGASAVIGIDPAENLRPKDNSGIISICGLFDPTSASIARSAMPAVNVVIARHVFAHVDDWIGFMASLDTLANKNTLIVIECPYAQDLLDGVEFDTIYHEHLSYLSIRSVDVLLKHTPFHLHKIVKFSIHGGAVVMMLRRNDCDISPCSSVQSFLKSESISLNSWLLFGSQARERISDLRRAVSEKVYGESASVCGFGASAKSTVWINACGFRPSEISFICDSTPQKQGKLSPGSGIPIVDESALLQENPQYAVCFAWNFIDEIMRTQKPYLDNGGKFIVPVPQIRVIPE